MRSEISSARGANQLMSHEKLSAVHACSSPTPPKHLTVILKLLVPEPFYTFLRKNNLAGARAHQEHSESTLGAHKEHEEVQGTTLSRRPMPLRLGFGLRHVTLLESCAFDVISVISLLAACSLNPFPSLALALRVPL